MPELPELEVVQEVLNRRVGGRTIRRVTVDPKNSPLVLRDLAGLGFQVVLPGSRVERVQRQGKFLLWELAPASLWIAIQPKLTGRLQLCPPKARRAGPLVLTLHFVEPEEEVRYLDRKRMGQVYLTEDLAAVPTLAEMGPDALAVSQDEFRRRLRAFRGEIKGILARERFVSGVGNAYADEILWAARIHPFRKRPTLIEDEVDRLFDAMRETLLEAVEAVRLAMGEEIHLKPRDFFAVHLRGGQPCPRCRSPVSQITARQRVTNFCRTCQPGGLIRGM